MSEAYEPAKSWRFASVLGVIGVLALVVGGRLVQLQLERSNFLKDVGEQLSVSEISIRATRGVISDRRGEPLAVSTPVAAVVANPQRLQLDEAGLAALAGLLDYSSEALRNRLSHYADKQFVYLRRRVAPETAQQVEQLDMRGVRLKEEYQRYYPAGEVAAHVVGLTDIDEHGLEGVELAYDASLAGSDGRKRVLHDRRASVVRDLKLIRPAEPGQDLSLSLDLRLQYVAYRELKAAVRQNRARAGSAVVLDVRTGEVLAMVNQPAYNPNGPVPREVGRLRNRAVTDAYEPGSTVKPLTMIAALGSGVVTPETVIDTSPGTYRVDGKLIRDPVDRGKLTMRGILQKSSQVGISHVAKRLDERTLRNTFARFGFGSATGIGFPGEAVGVLPHDEIRPLIERVTMAFGYGVAVTPLQLAHAFSTLASDGKRRPLSLQRLDPAAVPAGRQVVPAALARRVRHMLEAVVLEAGTGTRAAIPGYRVAGKTGTVEKIGPDGYDPDRHLAYFVGMAPARDPRLTTVVMIDEPHGESTGGGQVAAPVFARVMAGALRLLDVAPTTELPREEGAA